jgi:hypothetical protein
MKDITGAKAVQVQIRADRRVLWINVDGLCALRICQIDQLEIEDNSAGGEDVANVLLREADQLLSNAIQDADSGKLTLMGYTRAIGIADGWRAASERIKELAEAKP